MTGAVASSSLSRRTPHLLVGNPCRHAVNFSTRLPQPLARHLARNAPDPRLQPTVVPYFKPHSRYLTQTPVTLRKKPTDGPRTESSASGASSTIHSAGQAANSQGGDAEPMNGALGRDLSSTPPTPPPQPPPPHSSQASQAPGSFSAIPFSTGSGIFDAFLTTVVGLGMGECGVLWLVVYCFRCIWLLAARHIFSNLHRFLFHAFRGKPVYPIITPLRRVSGNLIDTLVCSIRWWYCLCRVV